MDRKATNIGKSYLEDFTLHLADSSLIMAHRLSEWTGHGPSVEQDIAITNIALDLLGQARNFYQYAADIMNSNNTEKKITEDDLAYLRDSFEFKNFLITELPNGDWAQTVGKIFFFSTWQFFLYQKLIYNSDKQLSAISEKSLKEVTYHIKWSSDWVIRLADGTIESRERMKAAIEYLWPYTGEMFVLAEFELNGENTVTIDVSTIKKAWLDNVKLVLAGATLDLPKEAWMHGGGKNGIHTEHLGYVLAEMQYMQRAYPGLEW